MARLTKTTQSANTLYTKKYETFRGVDFSHDAALCDDEHSPYAENLISATDGLPEKRVGWRKIMDCGGRINGIYSFGAEDEQCVVIHAGDKILKLADGVLTELMSGIADRKSTGKYFKGKLCILTGEEYLVFDGEDCVRAGEYEDIYAPITLMSREGMNVKQHTILSACENYAAWVDENIWKHIGGAEVERGSVPEDIAVNLVSGRRKNHFRSVGAANVFILDSLIDSGSRVIMKCISTGDVVFDLEYDESRGSDYYYKIVAGENGYINTGVLNIRDGYSYEPQYYVCIRNVPRRNTAIVELEIDTRKMPGYVHIDGVDDFSIEFTHTVEGYAERIDKCTVMDIYENRLFFSGNPEYPNADWSSGVNDPLYIPDINYTEIGMDSSRIMGYLRTGSEQAILKSDGDDATIYMRSSKITDDGSLIFPIRQGTSGIAAVSEYAICTFLDDPLYLSRNGVYAIAKQDISSERALNIRSTRINKRLLEEMRISDAVMCEWSRYLLLCVNGNVYVADAAQKQYLINATNTFEYEWYFWTNIPARVFYEKGGELYFGTESGELCKFNSDLDGAERYSDNGAAISAEWATNLSDDGSFMQEKTLVKTGSGIKLRSGDTSEIKVTIYTEDGRKERLVLQGRSMLVLNTRLKKYRAIQIVCKNDKVGENFGISGITRRYFYGKTKK